MTPMMGILTAAIIVPLLLTERFVASGPFLVASSLWSALRVSGTAMKSMESIGFLVMGKTAGASDT